MDVVGSATADAKVEGVVVKRWSRIVMAVVAVLASGCGVLLIFAHAAASDPRCVEAARLQLETALDADIVLKGPVEITVVPQPRLTASDVDVVARQGGMRLNVTTLQSSIGLLPLLHGRVTFGKVRVMGLTATIDADRLTATRRDTPRRLLPSNLGSRLTLTSGLIQVRSSHHALQTMLTDVHAVVGGLDGGPATLSGGATWHGQAVELSGRIDSLAALLEGTPTVAAGKIRSRLFSASVSGAWDGGWGSRFTGTASAALPAVPALLRLVEGTDAGAEGLHRAAFSGTAETSPEGIAFTDAKVTLNDGTFEGTLALQFQHGRLGLVGTVATDVLDLQPFLAAMPLMRRSDGAWNDTPLPLTPCQFQDVDLRISANTIRMDRFAIEDAAVSALCRDKRMEVSLGEARAYGGLVKGRLITTRVADELEAKVDASWSRVDLDQLVNTFQASPQQVSGSATGSLTAEGRGRTIAAFVDGVRGRGQASVRQGTFTGVPLVEALLDPAPSTPPARDNAAESIDLAAVDFVVADGRVTIANGMVNASSGRVTIGGEASLRERSYALFSRSVLSGTGGEGRPTALVNVSGPWGGPIQRSDLVLPPTTGLARPVPPPAMIDTLP